jgi:ribosomal-protein-alanine N-acetyltransferase
VTPALFHVSHEGPFTVLDARSSVWAIDEAHLAHYLVPRDCPRVCRPGPDGPVVHIEAGWAHRLDDVPLHVHRLAPEGFAVLDAGAGYWTKAGPAAVASVETIPDCRAALAARGAELRVVDDLWPLVDEVVAAGGEFSCIRMREARPRRTHAEPPAELRTERLVLRRWRDEDRAPFAALNADAEVMRHLPAPLTRAESDAMVDRIEARFAETGFGLWAAETPALGFIGFVGLAWQSFPAPFTPAVEVGWRLARAAWGRGLAPEAARAVVADGFARLAVDEIVSMTATTNLASQRVMQKIGMTRDPADDFEHPNVPEGDPLRPHVLYRLARPRSDQPEAQKWHQC